MAKNQVTVKMEGVQDVIKAINELYPKNETARRSLLHSGMAGSMRKNMLPTAKQLAAVANRSGALSESLKVRAIAKGRLRFMPARADAGVEMVPVRHNHKAVAKYAMYYYVQKGKAPPDRIFASGIRHGHLVEYGSVNNDPAPYLYPAATGGRPGFERDFSTILWKKTKARVQRTVRKAKKLK